MNELLSQDKSIYLQLSEMIETDILRGILLEEERVPSTNKRKDAFYENYMKGLLEEAKSLGISSDQLIEMIRAHE